MAQSSEELPLQNRHNNEEQGNQPSGESRFSEQFFCYPMTLNNQSHLQNGNRIIMPASALDRLAKMNIEYPMLFEIENPEIENPRVSHCGVWEFSAEEGSVLFPDQMMRNLQLLRGQLVSIKSTSLPKGTYLKIQPHTMKFTELSNPKAVLERTLRSFSCLTIGDTVKITDNCNDFYINILETRPSNSNAVSVVETDCEVDFAPPLDYKEPEKKPKAPPLDDKEPEKKPKAAMKTDTDTAQEVTGEEESKFRPFTGVARRLDGTPSTASAEQDYLSTSKVKEDDGVLAGKNIASESKCWSRKRPGTLVFGSEDASQSPRKSQKGSSEDASQSPRKSKKGSKQDVRAEDLKNDQQKFQPFTGKKYTLGS